MKFSTLFVKSVFFYRQLVQSPTSLYPYHRPKSIFSLGDDVDLAVVVFDVQVRLVRSCPINDNSFAVIISPSK